MGKTGAAIGVEVFNPIKSSVGLRYVFIVAAGIGLLGIVLAFFTIVDTTKLDLAEEDRSWEKYLADHGWRGTVGSNETSWGQGETIKGEHRIEASSAL